MEPVLVVVSGSDTIFSSLNIALYGKMSRTGSLTRRCTGVIAVDFGMIPVIRSPFVRSPFFRIRKQGFRIGNLALFCTQLLPKFGSAYWTDLHTLTTGNAFACFHMGTVGRAGHIRCVEQLRCTQCIADTRCTVADGEDLIFPSILVI